MKWIRSNNLESWAETLNSRAEFAELVRSLVRSSVKDFSAFRFLTGDSAQGPGYDGRLIAKGVPPYIPDGSSVWEFGTDRDYLSKANEEYAKRCRNSLGVAPKESTFVFATPRVWKRPKPTIEEWQQQKIAEGPWKDVRVIDGTAVEQWLEEHPPVAAWAAHKILGLPAQTGARSTDEFWDEYVSNFRPQATEKVLLCGRDEQAKALLQALQSVPNVHVWQADSADEVLAFAVAAIRAAAPEERKFLEARSLILDTEEAARQMAAVPNLIFFPRQTAIGVGGLLGKHGPTIVSLAREGSRFGTSTLLKRPTSHEMAEALQTMHLSPEAANQTARKCARSVTILGRLIPSASAPKPQWHGQKTLVPALLAGAWNASSEQDRKIIQRLAGVENYHEYEDTLRAYAHAADPALEHEGEIWKLRAPVDAFAHLGHLIGKTDIERVRFVFVEVFKELDPSLDLQPGEDLYAELQGKNLKHSSWLRDGLATTCLLLAVLGDAAGLDLPGGNQAFVDALIKELPGLNSDWRLLASLASQFPLLMEAAPRPLVLALEQMLEGDRADLARIFRDTDALFSRSAHTGLLWGLEVAAWDPDYLSRVGLILARLARIDPGGKLVNRPLNSLREIFLAWHPNTNASLEQRLAAIDHLAEREPEVGWKLIQMLLPEQHSVAQNTAMLRFREAGASEKQPLTRQLVAETFDEIINRALALADDNAERWVSIVSGIPTFANIHREKACDLLEAFIKRADSAQRLTLWTALRELINRHKAFQEAAWSMKLPELARMESIAQQLEPSDALARMAWLFNDHHPAVPGAELDSIERAREAAVRQAFEAGGVDLVIELATLVAFPRYIAPALPNVTNDFDVFDTLIDRSLGMSDKLNEFSTVLSASIERKNKEEWKTRLLARAKKQKCAPDNLARLIIWWKDEPDTWHFANALGPEAERLYWHTKPVWPLKGEPEALEHAARKYAEAGRALSAIEAVYLEVAKISPQTVFNLLDKAVDELNSSRSRSGGMLTFELGRIFDSLAARSEVPVLELAKREYAYLSLLEHSEHKLTLHKILAQDPVFFVSVICDAFRAARAKPTDPTPDQRQRARAGYQLLSGMETVPGQNGEDVDTHQLGSWIDEVQRHASEEDRAKIADEYIGHVLAHAPFDQDGIWPHCAVRDVLERLASADIELGIKVERFNMRGGFTKAMYEGGAQERGLAEQARGWSKGLTRWPRTQKMMLEIADDWNQQAGREDERARQDELRFES